MIYQDEYALDRLVSQLVFDIVPCQLVFHSYLDIIHGSPQWGVLASWHLIKPLSVRRFTIFFGWITRSYVQSELPPFPENFIILKVFISNSLINILCSLITSSSSLLVMIMSYVEL